MRGSLLLLSLVAVSIPVRAEDSPRPQPQDEARQRIEAFYQRSQEDLGRALGPSWRQTLGASALFQSLAGHLDQARVTEGTPAGVAFPVTVNGRRLSATFLPATTEPPQPDRVVLIEEDGQAHAVAADTLRADPGQAFTAALASRPVRLGGQGTVAADGRLSGSALAESGRTALAHARAEAGTAPRAPQETPYGTRYFDGAGANEELYSRELGGQHAFLRYENGVPRVTHLWQDGAWKPLAGELPAAMRQPFLQQVGGTLYAYRLNPDGTGARTHQAVEDGSRWAWLPLADGQPLAALPAGTTRRLARSEDGRSQFLVEFSQNGTRSRVAAAGDGGDGDTLRPLARGGTLPASFTASASGRAADGSAASFWHSFTRQDDGSYRGELTHQLVNTGNGAQGWFRLAGGRTLPAQDLTLARQVVAVETRVEAGRRQAEAQRNRGLYGASAYPSVASLASSQLGPAPAPISTAEVYRRAGGDPAAVPGTGVSGVSVLGPSGTAAPRRNMVIVAGNEADGEQTRALLEDYKRRLTLEGGRLLLNGGLGSILHGGPSPQTLLTPDRVTIALATDERLRASLAEVNRDLAQAPYIAAGIGALENPQAGRGERALERPGIFGVRGRIAERRVVGGAAANSGRAQAEMQQGREQAADLVSLGLWAGRSRAALEAAQQFRANGIANVSVIGLGGADDEARVRASVGSGGVAIPYRLADGGTYLHRVSVDESVLPRRGNGLQLAAAVDAQLASQAHANPGGLPPAAVENTWTSEIRRLYGVSEETARSTARTLLAPPPAPAPATLYRSAQQPVTGIRQGSDQWYYGSGPRGETYYFTGRYDGQGREVWQLLARR